MYFDHQTPAFAPPSLSPSPSLPHHFTYTQTCMHTPHAHARAHTHTHTHTHRVEFSHLSSHLKSLSLSLSLSHTHTDFSHLSFHPHTHTLTAVFVASSEHAKNSVTRNSPYNPSPFPLVPHLPTTAQSLLAGNRHTPVHLC